MIIPGRQFVQYQVTSLSVKAYERAAEIGTISNGFRATIVWPVNKNSFAENLSKPADGILNNEITLIL